MKAWGRRKISPKHSQTEAERGLAEALGASVRPESTALLVGSYVITQNFGARFITLLPRDIQA